MSTPRLFHLSRYVYGTTRLGHADIPRDARVEMAKVAIQAGGWMHTSHTYDDALTVLREASDSLGMRLPPAIFKIGWNSADEVRAVIDANLSPLAASHMAVGQLCLGGPLAEEFRTGGDCYADLAALKSEGIVGQFVLECWPWNSNVALDALRAGYALNLIDGLIFYFNPLQRFVSDELWEYVVERQIPVIAMRTVCGGNPDRTANGSTYLASRAKAVLPLYAESGCGSWTEFCVRFALGFPFVQATVGSTSRPEALAEFMVAAEAPQPLGDDLVRSVLTLQHEWSEAHDRHAEPWSM